MRCRSSAGGPASGTRGSPPGTKGSGSRWPPSPPSWSWPISSGNRRLSTPRHTFLIGRCRPERRVRDLTILVNDVPRRVEHGTTLAAALLTLGEDHFRVSGDGTA